MIRNRNSDMRKIKKASMNQVHPIIESFFKRIPDDTWASLMVDWLNGSTRDDLKELLRKVTVIISNSMTASLNNQKRISKEDVLSTWGHVVPEAFALVLGASEDVSCETADELDNLILAEVVRSVNAAIYTGNKIVETAVFENQLGGHRLNTVVQVANKMIKYYMCSFHDDVDKGLQENIVELPATPVTSLPPEVDESPKNKVESFLEFSLGEVLESYLPEELIYEVTDTADDPENTPAEVHVCEQPAPRASATEVSAKRSETEPHIDFSKDLKEDIRKFLSMVNESIWEVEAGPITAAGPWEHIVWGVESDDDKGLQEYIVELPATPVTSLTSEEEDPLSEMESSIEISLGEVLELFLPEELIYEVTDTTDDPENTPAEVHVCEQPAPRASATEVSAKRSETEAHRESNEEIKEIMFKLSVDVCAESLVQRLVEEAPQFFDEDDMHALKTRLCDKFWVEIQNKYWNIPIEKFKKLDKLIYEDLLKDCRYRLYMLKQCVEEDDSLLENAIIYYYAKHLEPPSKKRSPVRRIFSAVGSAITKVFRGYS